MFYGGRLILIIFLLTKHAHVPFILLSSAHGGMKKVGHPSITFFWQTYQHKIKVQTSKWDIICRPKDQVGLGIKYLEVNNRCMLSKWLYRLSVEGGGVWIQLLCNNYLQSKTLAQVMARPNYSPFLEGLLRTKIAFFNMRKFFVGIEKTTRFWKVPGKRDTVSPTISTCL